MEAGLSGAASAVWLGILTAISPCPMATNIAAISYVGGNTSPRRTHGLLHGVGHLPGCRPSLLRPAVEFPAAEHEQDPGAGQHCTASTTLENSASR